MTALWWTLWTLVIVPIHTRGAIPQSSPVCPMCAACCEKPGPSAPANAPVKDPSENCAICHVVATLATTPTRPVFTHTFVMIERLETLHFHPAILNGSPERLLCRGPPSV